ncbi:MAG: hypothetical protein WCA16_18885 [Candidatus Sulfotelmatobacter sp.]
MKAFKLVAVALLACASVAFAQSDAQKTLDRFKSMAGTWEGKDAKGGPVVDTYQITAGGTAVMGDNKMGEEEMLSLFYVDGDRLLMTHFCPSGNQPRMKASFSPDLKTLTFRFLDATNLPDLQAGHMSNAVYVFNDADHYTEEWTWSKGGKDTVFHFEMQRKK